MVNILKKIVKERKMQLFCEKKVKLQPSLLRVLNKDGLQIIGEIKRASPSKGQIAEDDFNIEEKLSYYLKNKVSSFSVLTEYAYFKGCVRDLSYVRTRHKNVPILRKDFIFDEFQVAESKFIGASAILLIVKMLKPNDLKRLHALALKLDLEVLVEVRDEEDLETALKIKDLALIGINNRDLNTFEIDLKTTERLMKKIPKEMELTIVSESGVKSKEDLKYIESLGVDGILVGESLMEGTLF